MPNGIYLSTLGDTGPQIEKLVKESQRMALGSQSECVMTGPWMVDGEVNIGGGDDDNGG